MDILWGIANKIDYFWGHVYVFGPLKAKVQNGNKFLGYAKSPRISKVYLIFFGGKQ